MAAEKKLTESLIESINKLKKKRNAIILAHVYQRGEVQDIADFVGDSLDLSRRAVCTKADVIVFCGVQFMAETAAILNPYKTVLLPDKNAGCGLADMATDEQIIRIKKQNPGIGVVSYVNSSASVKAVSDICCTSANAVNVVNSLSFNPVLFVPDRNLGSYVAEQTKKDIRLWEGFCYVHEHIISDKLKHLKEKHPYAEIIVHPECTTPVRHMADFTGSTSQMSKYVKQSQLREFIVGTEDNFIYRLKSDNPDKLFYPANTLCEGMNTITLEKVKFTLEKMKYKVHVPEETREKAEIALDKMLTVS
ncbi:MAG: quinolinate synthase NadA [Bacteroidales bacterium]|nr:quinolinate synthase NadA [Bacteroidales bacterium]